jgi:hypothetical protein
VEILLWLVPPAIVTVLAMGWVSWLGREGRGDVDREQAARRLARAMQKEHPGAAGPRPVVVRDRSPDRSPDRSTDRSTGIAVRRSTRRAS